MSDNEARRIHLYILIHHKRVLKHLASFTENVAGCNFTMSGGWSRKYVDKHGVGEYRPELRADAALELYHISLTDTLTLTEDQYADFKRVTMLWIHPQECDPRPRATPATRS